MEFSPVVRPARYTCSRTIQSRATPTGESLCELDNCCITEILHRLKGKPEWVGELLAARFRLTGPWVKRELSLPILLCGPMPKVYRRASAAGHGDITDYCFRVSDQDERVLPWVEVKYPHHTRRMTLTAPPKD